MKSKQLKYEWMKSMRHRGDNEAEEEDKEMYVPYKPGPGRTPSP
jgi:hypothetical protein